MGWKPGESGNPKGRPPEEQALSAILRRVGEEVTNLIPGSPKKYQYNEILAHYLWQAAVFGRFKFRDGQEIIFNKAGAWLNLIKWLYDRIDGPPKQSFSVDANMVIELAWADEDNPPLSPREPENDSPE